MSDSGGRGDANARKGGARGNPEEVVPLDALVLDSVLCGEITDRPDGPSGRPFGITEDLEQED